MKKIYLWVFLIVFFSCGNTARETRKIEFKILPEKSDEENRELALNAISSNLKNLDGIGRGDTIKFIIDDSLTYTFIHPADNDDGVREKLKEEAHAKLEGDKFSNWLKRYKKTTNYYMLIDATHTDDKRDPKIEFSGEESFKETGFNGYDIEISSSIVDGESEYSEIYHPFTLFGYKDMEAVCKRDDVNLYISIIEDDAYRNDYKLFKFREKERKALRNKPNSTQCKEYFKEVFESADEIIDRIGKRRNQSASRIYDAIFYTLIKLDGVKDKSNIIVFSDLEQNDGKLSEDVKGYRKATDDLDRYINSSDYFFEKDIINRSKIDSARDKPLPRNKNIKDFITEDLDLSNVYIYFAKPPEENESTLNDEREREGISDKNIARNEYVEKLKNEFERLMSETGLNVIDLDGRLPDL